MTRKIEREFGVPVSGEILEPQHWTRTALKRLPDEGPQRRFGYVAPEFSVTATLIYDASGLLVDYPGIAVRAH